MNKFNEAEFKRISSKLNENPYVQELSIRYLTNNFYNKIKKSVEKDRSGEVVFCAVRPNGKIVGITCKEYPSGIFRIPTGGIRHGEDVLKALFREVKEELGIEVDILHFPGVLKIRFEYENESVMFYSYIFILQEKGGRLLLDATDNEVSEVMEYDIDGFQLAVDGLQNIQGKWSDWGKFRYVTSNAVLEFLKTNYVGLVKKC